MKMTRQHFEWLADKIAPRLPWPTHIEVLADELAATNPRFDRDKFVARAVKNWEDNYNPPEIDDFIPEFPKEYRNDERQSPVQRRA